MKTLTEIDQEVTEKFFKNNEYLKYADQKVIYQWGLLHGRRLQLEETRLIVNDTIKDVQQKGLSKNFTPLPKDETEEEAMMYEQEKAREYLEDYHFRQNELL